MLENKRISVLIILLVASVPSELGSLRPQLHPFQKGSSVESQKEASLHHYPHCRCLQCHSHHCWWAGQQLSHCYYWSTERRGWSLSQKTTAHITYTLHVLTQVQNQLLPAKLILNFLLINTSLDSFLLVSSMI